MHSPRRPAPGALPELRGGDASIVRALDQGLDTPLAALRATVESLKHELDQASGVAPRRIEGVLDEVERIGKNVRELCELASVPTVRPLTCSLEEVIVSARAQLPREQRARVVVARCDPGARLRIDGPLLSACLRRLLENALEASEQPVLVVGRIEGGTATFSVLDEAPSKLGPAWRPVPFQTTKPNHLGLGLTLTERDIGLLGGRLEFLSGPGAGTCARITLPIPEQAR